MEANTGSARSGWPLQAQLVPTKKRKAGPSSFLVEDPVAKRRRIERLRFGMNHFVLVEKVCCVASRLVF
jgi:hypothetical protein